MASFGMSEEQIGLVKEIFSAGLRDHTDYMVWIYGSRARGDHRPYSDVDVLIKSSTRLSDLEKLKIEEKFENSSLPFKFDVVRDEDLFEGYRESVKNERILILEKK